jgi:uncharacterized DUF497 family protein
VFEFEWDEAKRLANNEKHDIDFAAVRQLFDRRPVVTFQSKYEAEPRFLTIGMLDQQLVTVVWTWRGSVIRLISARRASDEERRRFRQLFG